MARVVVGIRIYKLGMESNRNVIRTVDRHWPVPTDCPGLVRRLRLTCGSFASASPLSIRPQCT